MSKSEWRTACQRSAHRLDNLKINDITLGLPPKPATKNPWFRCASSAKIA